MVEPRAVGRGDEGGALAPRPGGRLRVLALGGLLLCAEGCWLLEDPISLTITPSSVSADFLQGDDVPQLRLDVSPVGNYYPHLMQDVGVLNPIIDSPSTPTGVAFLFKPDCSLAPGVHEGRLRVAYWADPFHQDEVPLENASVPYRFTVAPGPMLRVEVDGVPVGSRSACTYVFPEVHAGQVVTVTSGIPVTWDLAIVATSGMPSVHDISTSATTWTGTIGAEGGAGEIGTIKVNAWPTEAATAWPFMDVWLSVQSP